MCLSSLTSWICWRISESIPGAINTFFTSRGRLLKNFWSLLKTAPIASSEYELRPPTSPINSGFSLPKRKLQYRYLYHLSSPDNENILQEQKRLDLCQFRMSLNPCWAQIR